MSDPAVWVDVTAALVQSTDYNCDQGTTLDYEFRRGPDPALRYYMVVRNSRTRQIVHHPIGFGPMASSGTTTVNSPTIFDFDSEDSRRLDSYTKAGRRIARGMGTSSRSFGGESMICQACGVEAATKYVSFHQNIGALVIRFSKSIDGYLCKSCIHKHFWSMTGTTIVLGWWGTISFILTPFFLLNNIGRYLFCLGMPPVDPDARPPVLTDAAMTKLEPHIPSLFARINRGEDLEVVATSIAKSAGVTPGQVYRFVQMVAQSQK